MALSRRRFLGVAAGSVAAVGGVRLLQLTVFDDESAAPGHDRFLAAVGSTFTFRSNGRSTGLRLANVVSGPDDPGAANLVGESFALTFENPRLSTKALQQGTYRVSHPNLGRFPLFVAPASARGDAYAAVINRRVPKA